MIYIWSNLIGQIAFESLLFLQRNAICIIYENINRFTLKLIIVKNC